MNAVQNDLTIIGAHTLNPTIYWKGQEVAAVSSLKVVGGIVTLTVFDDPVLAEMADSGIKIVRV